MHAEYGIFVYTIWPLFSAAPRSPRSTQRSRVIRQLRGMSEPQPADGTRPTEPEHQSATGGGGAGGMLQRTHSPLSPSSAVTAGARLHRRASEALARTSTDSLELRTRRNSPRDAKDLPPTDPEEPSPDGSARLPPSLVASGRSRSLSGSVETLKAHERPRLSPKQAGIPQFKQSTDLTVKPPRSPPPFRYVGSSSFSPLSTAFKAATGTPRDSGGAEDPEGLETATSIAPEHGDTWPNGSRASYPGRCRCLTTRWQRCAKHAEDPRWVATVFWKCLVSALVVLLVLGWIGCSPHWFSADDPKCTESSSQQCGTDSLPLQTNATEVDPFIAQVEKTLEHVS
jgi:hypothetical protein